VAGKNELHDLPLPRAEFRPEPVVDAHHGACARLLAWDRRLVGAPAGVRFLRSSGYIWTPQTENFLREVGRLEEEEAKALSRHPIGSLGEPDDIAYMVLYLAPDESKFVTGSEMAVDGGYLMV
jgi:NAD(P)-dependent dehydrogenase (short-subunit alcohol dehydrogenase family)